MEKKHQDRVIVITGSSRGIGLGIARHLAEEGARIAVMGRNYDTAKAAADCLPTDCLAIRCDVSVEQDTIDMAKAVMDKYGRVDALVNNAGIFPVKLFEEMTLADWNAVMDIDLTGMFLATKAIYPFMAEQKSGKIVNIASIAGRVGGVGFTHYSAAKGGVIGFTKALARECARMNIQVNAVAPGIIETEMAKVNFPAFSLKEQTRSTPAGRLGTVEDLNGVISFLCSGESSFIVGQIIAVDGGYTMV